MHFVDWNRQYDHNSLCLFIHLYIRVKDPIEIRPHHIQPQLTKHRETQRDDRARILSMETTPPPPQRPIRSTRSAKGCPITCPYWSTPTSTQGPRSNCVKVRTQLNSPTPKTAEARSGPRRHSWLSGAVTRILRREETTAVDQKIIEDDVRKRNKVWTHGLLWQWRRWFPGAGSRGRE